MAAVSVNLWVAALGILVAAGPVLGQYGGWRTGRATFYGDEPHLWSIHKGSCGYGQLDTEKGTGWDIAAIPDAHYEYEFSCGRCYELKCNPEFFKDNYNATLDRMDACYDPNKSVIVTVTDTCPCNFPDNMESNKRWCCGDMDHLDISVYTFDKLADRKWGVIGLLYRPVACPDTEPQTRKDYGNGSRLNWLRDHLLKMTMEDDPSTSQDNSPEQRG